MKKMVMDAIKRVEDRELFEDGLSHDLHEANVRNEQEAFMLGRMDAIREVRETIESEFAKLVKPRHVGRLEPSPGEEGDGGSFRADGQE
jgi:hypothetical protein